MTLPHGAAQVVRKAETTENERFRRNAAGRQECVHMRLAWLMWVDSMSNG